jgi:PadR family transcriptional regulator, regulatory protein PadR
MARMDSLHGALPVMALKILLRRGPSHGYAIATRIEEMSEDILRVEEGSLYPALYRLEENAWIRAKWVTTENKQRARVYEITAAGRRYLENEEQRWRDVTAAIGRVLERA